MKKAEKIPYGLLAVCVAAALLRYVGGGILEQFDFYYKTWFLFTLDVLTRFGMVMMLEAILLHRMFWKKKETAADGELAQAAEAPEQSTGRKVFKSILAVLSVILLVIYFYICVMVMAISAGSSYEHEEKLLGGLSVGTRDFSPLHTSGQQYAYYEYSGIFVKKLCRNQERIVATVMSVRHQEDFILTESKTDEQGYYRGTGYLVSMPQMPIHVTGYQGNQYYSDDRTKAQKWLRIQEFLEQNPSDFKVEEPGKLYCTAADLPYCARDAADMIAYLMEDPYFQSAAHASDILIVCDAGEYGKAELTLPFGGKEAYQLYAEYDWAYKKCKADLETFLGAKARQEAEKTETSEEYEARIAQELAEQFAAAERDLTRPEGSGKKLYETVFQEKGYEYQPNYNAKGNFYALLETGEEVKDGKTFQTEHTIVYDRVSKNGKCQLFVEYQNFLESNGTYSTVTKTKILEFYAVDMTDGSVCSAGKKSWEEVGNAAYREMTGE